MRSALSQHTIWPRQILTKAHHAAPRTNRALHHLNTHTTRLGHPQAFSGEARVAREACATLAYLLSADDAQTAKPGRQAAPRAGAMVHPSDLLWPDSAIPQAVFVALEGVLRWSPGEANDGVSVVSEVRVSCPRKQNCVLLRLCVLGSLGLTCSNSAKVCVCSRL